MSSTPSFKIIVILASIGSLGPFAVDTYLPALPGMVEALGTTTGMIQWTLAAYLIGLAIFPLFLAPLSDAIGRKPILYWALAAFVVISALCAFAPNVEALIGLRLAQAAAGGTVMTVARAVLAEPLSRRHAEPGNVLPDACLYDCPNRCAPVWWCDS